MTPAGAGRRRWAALALGLVLAAVVVEICLQLGALAVAAIHEDIEGSWLTGETRILCIGDSNTFGLYAALLGAELRPSERDHPKGRGRDRDAPRRVGERGGSGLRRRFLHGPVFPDGHARPRAYRLMAEAIARDLALLRGGEAEELSRSR